MPSSPRCFVSRQAGDIASSNLSGDRETRLRSVPRKSNLVLVAYASLPLQSFLQLCYWQVQLVVKVPPQLRRCTNQLNMGRRVTSSERRIWKP